LIPPHDTEAERSTLGSLMIDEKAANKIVDQLNPVDFYEKKNQMIYQAMIELYEKDDPIDLVSVAGRLKEKKELKKIGGNTYLTELTNEVPVATNIVFYAKVVAEKATLRRLISTATQIVEMGYQEGEDIEKMLDQAEQKLFNVSQKFFKTGFYPHQKRFRRCL